MVLLGMEPVVLCVATYPNPLNATRCINADSAIVQADADRPKFFNALQLQRRVARIGFQQLVIFVGECLNVRWKFMVVLPIIRRSVVLQSSRALP